jgi:hypothetical protein
MKLLLAGGVLKLGSIDAVSRALGDVPCSRTLWNLWRGATEPSRKTVVALAGAPDEWRHLGSGWSGAIDPDIWNDPDRRYVAAQRDHRAR